MLQLPQPLARHGRKVLAAALALVVLASINVSATFAGSADRAGHGVLHVMTQPNVPSTIFVDGDARNTTKLENLELTAGEHEVTFSAVDGFLPPPPETVTITEGASTSLVGEFTPAGNLEVSTTPADVDAVISVDGIERDRGATNLVVAAGDLEVCGSDVVGFTAPECAIVSVAAGQTSSIELTFVALTQPVPVDSERVSDGLVSFYDFADGSSDKIADLVGGNDLTIATPSAVTWTEAGLRFDKATLASSSTAPKNLYDAVRASQEFTVEAWVTPANTTQNGPARIVSLGHDTSQTNFLVGQGEHEGTSTLIEARLHERSGDWILRTDNGTIDANLTHVVMTRSKDATVRIYLNGKLASQQQMATSLDGWDTSYKLGIGSELNGERPWLGTYHLTAIYDTALDATEITTNYQAGPGGDTDLPEPTDPEPAPEPVDAPAPADWQAAFDSGDMATVHAWYAANTGHEANGYSIGDLKYVGHIATEHDGQLIEGVHAESIRIGHDNVTIRNSRITGSWTYGIRYLDTWGRKNGGTLIEFVTFDGWKDGVGNINHATYLSANDAGATVRRVNITGYSSGVSMMTNTSFEESWVHGLYRGEGTGHGTSSTIRGRDNAVVRNLLEGPGGSSAVSLYADHGGPLHNALVEHNVLNDARPHYQINMPNREYSATSENVRVRHNRYGPNFKNGLAGGNNFTHPTTDIRDNVNF